MHNPISYFYHAHLKFDVKHESENADKQQSLHRKTTLTAVIKRSLVGVWSRITMTSAFPLKILLSE